MGEFLKKVKERVTQWVKDRWTWYYIGKSAFVAYITLMLLMLIWLSPVLDPDESLEFLLPKYTLWISQLMAIIFFSVEYCVDRPLSQRSLASTILSNHRYVVFGKNSKNLSRFFLAGNLFIIDFQLYMVVGFLYFGFICSSDCKKLMIVNIVTFKLQLLIRLGFSCFHNMTSSKALKEFEKAEEAEREKKGGTRWASKWNYYDIGCLFKYFNHLMLAMLLYKMLLRFWFLFLGASAKQKTELIREDLGRLLHLILLTFFCVERVGDKLPLQDSVIFHKTYVAFGRNKSLSALIQLILNVAMTTIFSTMVIGFYYMKVINENKTRTALLNFATFVFTNLMVRYYFTKYYNLTDPHDVKRITVKYNTINDIENGDKQIIDAKTSQVVEELGDCEITKEINDQLKEMNEIAFVNAGKKSEDKDPKLGETEYLTGADHDVACQKRWLGFNKLLA